MYIYSIIIQLCKKNHVEVELLNHGSVAIRKNNPTAVVTLSHTRGRMIHLLGIFSGVHSTEDSDFSSHQ
jgi:hypothetical protein